MDKLYKAIKLFCKFANNNEDQVISPIRDPRQTSFRFIKDEDIIIKKYKDAIPNKLLNELINGKYHYGKGGAIYFDLLEIKNNRANNENKITAAAPKIIVYCAFILKPLDSATKEENKEKITNFTQKNTDSTQKEFIAGILTAKSYKDSQKEADINIFVLPEYRQNNIGTKLYNAVSKDFKKINTFNSTFSPYFYEKNLDEKVDSYKKRQEYNQSKSIQKEYNKQYNYDQQTIFDAFQIKLNTGLKELDKGNTSVIPNMIILFKHIGKYISYDFLYTIDKKILENNKNYFKLIFDLISSINTWREYNTIYEIIKKIFNYSNNPNDTSIFAALSQKAAALRQAYDEETDG